MQKIIKSVPVHNEYERNGQKVLVYLAYVPIPCELCRKEIKPNELFSRSANRQGTIIGIRYSFCRDCMPFEEPPVAHEQRKDRIDNSKKLEQAIQNSLDWQFLAGCSDLVNFRLDREGNAKITDYMGIPLKREEVVWLMRVAQAYIEQNSTEQIDELIDENLNNLRQTMPTQPHPKK